MPLTNIQIITNKNRSTAAPHAITAMAQCGNTGGFSVVVVVATVEGSVVGVGEDGTVGIVGVVIGSAENKNNYIF